MILIYLVEAVFLVAGQRYSGGGGTHEHRQLLADLLLWYGIVGWGACTFHNVTLILMLQTLFHNSPLKYAFLVDISLRSESSFA